MEAQLKTQMEQAQTLIRDLAETASDWQGQGKAWLVVVAQLRKGSPDLFGRQGTGLDCAVREIERLQSCERLIKALREELSLAKGKAEAASADHSAATAEASAANESAAVAGVQLAQLWNALAANTQEQALSRVQALNRFFNLYTDLRSSMTEVEHAFRSADMVKGSEG